MDDVDVESGTCGSRIGSDRIGSDQRNVVLLVTWIPCLPPACVVCDAAALLLLYIVFDSLYDLDTFFLCCCCYDQERYRCAQLALAHSRLLSLSLSLAFSVSHCARVFVCVRCCSTTSQLIPYCGLLNVAPGVKSSTGEA